MKNVSRKIIIVIVSFIIIIGLLILSNLLWANLESEDSELIMRAVSALIIGLAIGRIAGEFWDS